MIIQKSIRVKRPLILSRADNDKSMRRPTLMESPRGSPRGAFEEKYRQTYRGSRRTSVLRSASVSFSFPRGSGGLPERGSPVRLVFADLESSDGSCAKNLSKSSSSPREGRKGEGGEQPAGMQRGGGDFGRIKFFAAFRGNPGERQSQQARGSFAVSCRVSAGDSEYFRGPWINIISRKGSSSPKRS